MSLPWVFCTRELAAEVDGAAGGTAPPPTGREETKQHHPTQEAAPINKEIANLLVQILFRKGETKA